MKILINERFEADNQSNELVDRRANSTSKLEPRLMKLLFLLVRENGRVVRRETIIGEIWDNYPGGSEGLNQAISFLRKVLEDEGKQLIQTVPKSGYSMNAHVAF